MLRTSASTGAAASGFVGRQDELQRAGEALDEAIDNGCRLLVVRGEAGMGKTALLREIASLAARRDAQIAWGTCWDAERAPGLWPWTQILRDAFEDRSEAEIDDLLGQERVELERLMAGAGDVIDPGDETDPQRAQFRMFDAIASVLRRVAACRLLVIVIDDVQWSDPSSLVLLDFLVTSHLPIPLLIVVAYRHDEVDPTAHVLLSRLSARARVVQLGGLQLSDVIELVAFHEGEKIANRCGPDIYRRTGGHPLFVKELSRLVRTTARDGAVEPVPAVIRDAVHRRIGGLSDRGYRVLSAAAVVGSDVHLDVLAEATDTPLPAIASLMEEAAAHGLLRHDESRTRFAHDLFREVLYDELPVDTRIALHSRVGKALEARFHRGGVVYPTEIARHCAIAVTVDGPDRAVFWAYAAATSDRARRAFAEAAEHLARARMAIADAGTQLPDSTVIELLLAEADARAQAGARADARDLVALALDRSRRTDDVRALATTALALDRLGARFAMPREEVVRALEEAAAAIAGRDPALEAQVAATLARALYHSVPEHRARARAVADHALLVARKVDDPETHVVCLLAQHDALWMPGTADKRLRVAKEIVAITDRINDRERHNEAILLVATALLETGAPTFRVELMRYLHLAEELGHPRHTYLAMTRRVALCLLDGDLDEADHRIEEAAAFGHRTGEPDAGNVRMSQRVELARALGDADRLRATAAQAVDWWIGIPSHGHAVAASLSAQAGDLGHARKLLDVVVELGSWQRDRFYLWNVLAGHLAVAAVALDDHEMCQLLLDELTPVASSCAVYGAIVAFGGSNAHRVGLLLASLGHVDEARTQLHSGLAIHQRLGARSWEAQTRAALATLPPSADHSEPRLIRHADIWTLHAGNETCQLKDTKGLRDLAVLLARPGQDVHVLELVGASGPTSRSDHPLLDRRALREVRQHLTDLDQEMDAAEADRDSARAELVAHQREALLAELRRATGSGGRSRQFTDDVERARKAVAARIRDAIRKIAVHSPRAGAHLDRSVVTGTYCRYQSSQH